MLPLHDNKKNLLPAMSRDHFVLFKFPNGDNDYNTSTKLTT